MITIYYGYKYSEEYIKDRDIYEAYHGSGGCLVCLQADGRISMKNFEMKDKKTAKKAAVEILDNLIKQKKLISYNIIKMC